MTRKVTLFAAIAALMIAASASAAELPPREWWRNPMIVQKLNISDDQQGKLDDIFRKSASELIDLRAEAEKLSIALHSELDQPQLNRANLMKLSAKLNEAHGKLFEREVSMLVDMREVLSDAQWAQLRDVVNKQGMRRGARAPR